MYLEHFGLQVDPFKLDPSLDFVFVSTGHEEAIAHLIYGIEQGESFVLITGGIGTGKTLSLHFLLDQIVSSFKTAFVNVTQINFLELLKLILDDLEIPFDRKGDRADLLSTFKKYLIEVRKKREKVLVVVDEAQELSIETLEALRLLSNLTQPGEQALQIVIAGQPGLVKMIADPKLEQLNQRIRVRYNLETLSMAEIKPYVEHRMSVAGCSVCPFTTDALERIFTLSCGVPRLVNHYSDQALLSAFVDGVKKVKGKHVEKDIKPDVTEVPELRPKDGTSPNKQKPEFVETTQQAMAAMENVDLDEIRDSRPRQNRSSKTKQAKSNALVLWIVFPLIVIAGSWYVYSQTDLLHLPWGSSGLIVENEEPEILIPGVSSSESNKTELAHKMPKLSSEINQEAPATEEIEEKAPVDSPPVLQYALHVASFLSIERAEAQISKFKEYRLDTFTLDTIVGDKTWIRLYVGPYSDSDLAGNQGLALKDQGIIQYFQVTSLSNGKS